jgi:hypothetical protein
MNRMHRSGALAVLAFALVACTSSDEPDAVAADTEPASTSDAAAAASPTTVAIAAPATTSPPTTAPPVSTAPSSTSPATSPPTTESCGAFCPLTEVQQAAVDRFFEAYNGDDWDALLAATADGAPQWQLNPVTVQNTELVRYDFIWAAGMNQVTTTDRCVDQYGIVACTVTIEDDLHRALAPFGAEPSTCQMSFDVADGALQPKSFSAFDCFFWYDGAMHSYGEWFASEYPDLDPISGVHYRAWNQTDESAAARASEHLDRWVEEVIVPFVEGGGNIRTGR